MAEAMFAAVRKTQDAEATEMKEEEIRDRALLLRPGFLDPLWTWRR
jgi:hypothetical protein